MQGGFAEHIKTVSRLGVQTFEIRQKRDLDKSLDALIIPGGESTVMGKLLRELDMFFDLKKMVEGGLPVYGTCAGLLLLAKDIEAGEQTHLETMDIVARRNAYGRQLGSFNVLEEFLHIGKVPMTFIRAPYIESASDNVEILARCNGKIVAARQGSQLVTAFHPELTEDTKVHEYFITNIVK